MKTINKPNDTINWNHISTYQDLSEDFMTLHKDKVKWNHISVYQVLSENFITLHKDRVNWYLVSIHQKLSEDFITLHKDRVKWTCISMYQILSEDFITFHEDRVDWSYISEYRVLSEDFIALHKDKVKWNRILKYQVLSEDFITLHKDKVDWDWDLVSKYQKLSKKFLRSNNLEIPSNNWDYVTNSFKLKKLKEINLYEIKGIYLYGYKKVRKDLSSFYDKRVKYKINSIVKDWHYDANCNSMNSFGLSVWTKRNAKHFKEGGSLLRVRVKITNIKALVHNGHKIRASELEVLEIVE